MDEEEEGQDQRVVQRIPNIYIHHQLLHNHVLRMVHVGTVLVWILFQYNLLHLARNLNNHILN